MKYEILKDEYIEFDGRKLYRIKALKDFRDVKKERSAAILSLNKTYHKKATLGYTTTHGY